MSQHCTVSGFWLGNINFGYTKLGFFLPKIDQVKKIFFKWRNLEVTKNSYLKKSYSVENYRDFSEKEYLIMRANFNVEIC